LYFAEIKEKTKNIKIFDMLFNKNLVDAVRDCVARGVDDLGQSGLTDGHGWGSDDGIAGVSERSSSVAKDCLALSTDGRGSGGLGSGDKGSVIGLGLGHFGSVLDREGCYRIVDGSDGQVVGLDAKASGVGSVGDTDFLAFRVDVSVAADLVAETVTEVSGGLSGVSIAKAGLTELVLSVVLGGGDRRVAVSDG
jgi:hypothetical protein